MGKSVRVFLSLSVFYKFKKCSHNDAFTSRYQARRGKQALSRSNTGTRRITARCYHINRGGQKNQRSSPVWENIDEGLSASARPEPRSPQGKGNRAPSEEARVILHR
jgi:hypothetical protein